MKFKKMHWFGIAAGVIILSFAFIFFLSNERMLMFLIGLALGAAALPFIVGLTLESKKDEQTNVMFLEFTRNLAESVSVGTPISKAIVNMQKKNYGVLNVHVRKLANQITLGIPLSYAFQTFADEIGSKMVKRAVALIREAERAGGEIDFILDSTARSISEIEKLKKERKTAIYGLVVQGYIIFFIFIGIVLVMEFRIIPLSVGIGPIAGFSGNVQDFQNVQTDEGPTVSAETFTRPFLYLLITQGFFIGLLIGKLAEGSLKKGLMHSFILMITALLVSSGARLFFGNGGA